MTPRQQRLGAPSQSLATAADPMVGLRLVRIDGFEPAAALGEAELPAYLRRFSLLFADDATMRRGGIGRVLRAVNAQGEAFALKTLILPERDEAEAEEEHAALIAKFKAAFREEYECHRALSGLKGFPRLWGWGEVEGVPAIVMEWVEGETLSRLRRQLAVDDAGRLSPYTAGCLARDLFDLLCRMGLVGEGFVHRDISPANIMVRTARLPLERQLAEGSFDLCLIDFGSSLALEPAATLTSGSKKASFTERYATLRRATVAYAPPEMLTDDLPDLRSLRMSPSIDVYAAASVAYELMEGCAPFDGAPAASGSGTRAKTRDLASPYRIKMDTAPGRPRGAHAAAEDLSAVLVREPDVAVAAAEQAQQLGVDPDSPELADALAFVDEQLADTVLSCLAPAQSERPEADDVYASLKGFCENYAQNVARSLRGEPLLVSSSTPAASRARRCAGIALASAAGVLWLGVAVSASLLMDGAYARLALGPLVWEGALSGAAVAAALAVPAAAGLAASAAAHDARNAFLAGSLALAAAEVPVLVLLACLGFVQPALATAAVAATAAGFALVWFILALGYAFALPPAPLRRRRAAGVPLVGGAAAACSLAGVQPAAPAPSTPGAPIDPSPRPVHKEASSRG